MSPIVDRQHASRADLTAVVCALVYPSLLTLVYFVWAATWPTGVQQGIYLAGKSLQFVFPIAWVLLYLGERPRWVRPNVFGLTAGAGFGAVILLVTLAAAHYWFIPAGYLEPMLPALGEKLQGFGIAGAASYAALALFYSLLHSLLEEYYWRWFVFGRLQAWCTLPVAIALSSLGFAAHHVIVLAVYFGPSNPLTWLFSAAVAIGGAYWAWLYQRSGSLWGPWLSHLLIDAAIFIVGYELVADRFG